MSRRTKKKISPVVCAAVIALTAVLLWVTVRSAKSFQAKQADNPPVEKSSRVYLGTENIEWNGEQYALRRGIETYLILGIDMDDDRAAVSDLGGQADVLFLLVMDSERSCYRILQINRDTMTQVPIFSGDGVVSGESFMPVCLAHAFGSGGEDSCENTVRAVRYFLSDIKIDGYAAIDMDAIGKLNDAVGGVTLTVEDDMTVIDPSFTKGAEVHLDAQTAEAFLRARMSLGETNNIKRMERHRQYMDAWIAAARGKMHGDSAEITKFIDKLREGMVTDMTEKRMAAIADDAFRYEDGGFLTVTGENVFNGSHNQFFADEDSVMEVLLELFYEKLA